jgi:hypothetical protein
MENTTTTEETSNMNTQAPTEQDPAAHANEMSRLWAIAGEINAEVDIDCATVRETAEGPELVVDGPDDTSHTYRLARFGAANTETAARIAISEILDEVEPA